MFTKAFVEESKIIGDKEFRLLIPVGCSYGELYDFLMETRELVMAKMVESVISVDEKPLAESVEEVKEKKHEGDTADMKAEYS